MQKRSYYGNKKLSQKSVTVIVAKNKDEKNIIKEFLNETNKTYNQHPKVLNWDEITPLTTKNQHKLAFD